MQWQAVLKLEFHFENSMKCQHAFGRVVSSPYLIICLTVDAGNNKQYAAVEAWGPEHVRCAVSHTI